MNVTELSTPGKEADAKVLTGTAPDKSDVKQVEILIHTRKALDESAAEYVIQKLNHMHGVFETRYNPAKNHLLIVNYALVQLNLCNY